MTDGSEEPSIEELEAELGMDDSDAGASSGGAGADDGDATGDGDLGLEEDASSQYGDLLDDVPSDDGGGGVGDVDPSAGAGAGNAGVEGASAGAADAPAGATDASAGDADSGSDGILSRLFGGGDEPAAASSTDATVEQTAGSDALDGLDSVGGVDDLDGIDGVDGLDTEPASAGGVESGGTASQADAGSRFAGLGSYFSVRAFLASLVAITVLGGVGRLFVPLIGGVAGLAAGAFLVALASGDGRYAEAGLAGAVVGAVGTLLGGITVAFAAGATTRLLAVGGVGGLVLALVGAYFGNDLRAGLVGGSEDWSEGEL